MRLAGLAVILAVGLLAAPLGTAAQQAQRVCRVGFVSLGAPPTRHGMWQNLLDALRAMNYIEGQNLVVSLAIAEGKPERLPGLVAEIMQEKLDVIVTTSTLETTMAPGASQKLVELLREAVPSAPRFGVLRTGARSPFPEIRHELDSAARQIGVPLVYLEGIRSPDDFDPVLARAKKDGVGGIIAPLGAFTSRTG